MSNLQRQVVVWRKDGKDKECHQGVSGHLVDRLIQDIQDDPSKQYLYHESEADFYKKNPQFAPQSNFSPAGSEGFDPAPDRATPGWSR